MAPPDPETDSFEFSATIWEHDGDAAWHFLSLPEPVADDIEARYGGQARGFGSVRVEVTIGSTTWRTSVFPDRANRTYVLPVKKAVRAAEDLRDGSVTDVRLVVIM